MKEWLPILIVVAIPTVLFFWHYMHKKHNGLKGAMGWILVFNIGTFLGGFSYFGVDFQNKFLEKSTQYVGIFVFILSIYSIYLTIYKQNTPETPKKVIRLLWLRGPIAYFVSYATLIIYLQSTQPISPFSMPLVYSWTTYIEPILVGVVIILISFMWTLYFKNSLRVKNTYLTNHPIDKNYVKKIVGLFILIVLISFTKGFVSSKIERDFVEKAVETAIQSLNNNKESQIEKKTVTPQLQQSTQTNQYIASPIDAPEIQNKPSNELADIIIQFMPSSTGKDSPWWWDYQANNENIVWIKEPYIEQFFKNGNNNVYRLGIFRASVDGEYAQVLRDRLYEVPWTVLYQSQGFPAKFGFDEIEFTPSALRRLNTTNVSLEISNNECFGSSYKNCDQNPLPSLLKKGVSIEHICTSVYYDDMNKSEIYLLKAPNKIPTYMETSISGGSGGTNSNFKIFTRENSQSIKNRCSPN